MTATVWSNRAAERFLEQRRPARTLSIGAAPHSFDGSSYYRVWLPFKHLSDNTLHGVSVADPTGPLLTPAHVEGLDVLMLQRPAGTAGLRLLESLAGQVKLVYEVDDDMLQVDPAGLPHLYNDRLRESVRRCLRLVDMVTTTNEYLADTLRPYNDNIVILPNYVKAGLLDVRRPRRDRLVIGYAGGTSHAVDLATIQDVLRDTLDDHPEVEMHWMGQDHSPWFGRAGNLSVTDPAKECRWTIWQQDVGEYYKHIDFDIAIAPSAAIPFNQSKTPIRALEMAALGIPIVAQNRLPYSEFVQDGDTGFLVDTPDQWAHALDLLINDEAARDELGRNARTLAAKWTIEEHWHEWEAAYEKAAAL